MGFFWSSSPSWQDVSAEKRAQRDNLLASAQPFAPAEHQQYLDATATEIVQHIQKGEWTASVVLEAYIARAAQAQAQTNCLTEVFFEQAREDARRLDAHFADTGTLVGPLHGVPMSVKDQFNVRGVDSTIGFTRWAHRPADADASLVAQLRAAGAVPLAKTNVPQTMLAFECANPLWGRTLNPWSAAHTAGGSSGGEAALLALDGAALGIGSDVGGSLRIPSAYCGVYALKPGHGRVATEGSVGPLPGFEAVRAVAGPMGRSVADLELFLRVTMGARAEGDVGYFPAPVPYRDVQLPPTLKFAYYTFDGIVQASPACERAVRETVAALRKAGHECVEIELPTRAAERGLQIFTAITSADGYEKLLSHLGPDPKESALFLVTLGPKLPGFVRRLADWAVRTFFGDEIFGGMLLYSHRKSVREYYDWTAEKLAFEREWRSKIWGENDFDAIIAPTQAVPAVPHGGCDRLAPLANATLLYNIVDSPVGALPVTRVDPARDALTPAWFAGRHGSRVLEAEIFGKDLADAQRGGKAYDVQKMQGLPVGVQVVGRLWEEEKVVAVMRVVDEALGERGFGPGMWRGEEEKEEGGDGAGVSG
ncbi:amidase [Auriscalpium vulgare]|uniref:Amidase n=1 Tax=Auriscalpium vulgare TaxID=40419 RepID=A0ACB8S584_9AGAM|nr:amidase [Auriscalpium vulgare]